MSFMSNIAIAVEDIALILDNEYDFAGPGGLLEVLFDGGDTLDRDLLKARVIKYVDNLYKSNPEIYGYIFEPLNESSAQADVIIHGLADYWEEYQREEKSW